MSSSQAPILHPPTKKTDEVDFTPLKKHIALSYSEDPENTRGAGKDMTGRDILYRYYGQLDLLEVRFPIDEKNSISQYSIAYEKASVIFNIAATCASIAALQNRYESAGQKVAFNYLQAAAGLFQYINENFLHAPSVDLSRDSIKSLVDLMLAQAQEVFLEKVLAEKKKGALPSKLAAQAAHFYAAALEGLSTEAVKGQFDKPWVEVVKIKAKLFESIAHLHRSYQQEDASKYGESVAHSTKAEILAKEAHKFAVSFNSSYSGFSTYVISPTLTTAASSTSAAGSSSSSLLEIAKANMSIATERKVSSTKDNDLIYHDLVPSTDTLPALEKVAIAKCITFAELCTGIIGPDIFQNLIPLSVHEASSMYSEEKAKILRAEQDASDGANEELQATLESLNLISTLSQLKQFARRGSAVDETLKLPQDIANFVQEVRSEESQRSSSTDELLAHLTSLKKQANDQMDEVGLLLDKEQFECEQQRAKYNEQWTQEPSSKMTAQIRQDVRQNRESFDKAVRTDEALYGRIAEAKREINIIRRPLDEVESIFAEMILAAAPDKFQSAGSLIDEMPSGGDEIASIEKIENMLAQLRNLKTQRGNLVAELKTKIHEDDIAGALVLNKNRESQVFQTELSKFQPFAHTQILIAVSSEFDKLRDSSTSMKMLVSRQKKRADLIKDFKRSYELWKESKEGLRKGIRFYTDLNELISSLRSTASNFVNRRNDERANVIKRIEEASAVKGQQALREQLARVSLSSGSPTYGQSFAGSPGPAGYPLPNASSPSGPGYPSLPSYPQPLPASSAAAMSFANYPYAQNPSDAVKRSPSGPGGYGSTQPPPPANPYSSDPYNPSYPRASLPPAQPPYAPAPQQPAYAPPPATAPILCTLPSATCQQTSYAPHQQQQSGFAPTQQQQPSYGQLPQQQYRPLQQQSAYSQPQQSQAAPYGQQYPGAGYGGGYSVPPNQVSNYAASPVGAPGYAAPPPEQYAQRPPSALPEPMQPGRWGQQGNGSLMD
ncbi:BRO1-like domain-containing protein [Chytridium lagenaria]|nr:BRO1-like domain-containing protein [Chytridium lagenaria]